jgi:hypothetical protein
MVLIDVLEPAPPGATGAREHRDASSKRSWQRFRYAQRAELGFDSHEPTFLLADAENFVLTLDKGSTTCAARRSVCRREAL